MLVHNARCSPGGMGKHRFRPNRGWANVLRFIRNRMHAATASSGRTKGMPSGIYLFPEIG